MICTVPQLSVTGFKWDQPFGIMSAKHSQSPQRKREEIYPVRPAIPREPLTEDIQPAQDSVSHPQGIQNRSEGQPLRYDTPSPTYAPRNHESPSDRRRQTTPSLASAERMHREGSQSYAPAILSQVDSVPSGQICRYVLPLPYPDYLLIVSATVEPAEHPFGVDHHRARRYVMRAVYIGKLEMPHGPRIWSALLLRPLVHNHLPSQDNHPQGVVQGTIILQVGPHMYLRIKHPRVHALGVVNVTALVVHKDAVAVPPLTIEFQKAHMLRWPRIDSFFRQIKHRTINQATHHPRST